MVDITLTDLATNNPITEDLDGEEPIETVVSGTSRGGRLRQLSSTPLNAQTSSYQLALADQGKCVTMDSASSTVVTVPDNATVAFPIGTTLLVRQLGDGGVTISAAGGVTIQKRASVSLILAERFATILLHKIATNTWHIAGELSAA